MGFARTQKIQDKKLHLHRVKSPVLDPTVTVSIVPISSFRLSRERRGKNQRENN